MQDQTSANFQAFNDMLPTLLDQYRGQHALLHSGHIVSYFSTSLEAIKAGYAKYGERNFSVELVDDTPEDLGFYSHVSASLRA